jgi:hypothetical protein
MNYNGNKTIMEKSKKDGRVREREREMKQE